MTSKRFKSLNPSILLTTIFLILLANFAEMKFCEEFRKNDFEIDFGFQRLRANNTFESYISISNIFFKVVFNENTTSDQSLKLIDKEIDVSFEKRYQMAFCVLIDGKCITGLVEKNSKTIDWFTSEESEDIFKNKVRSRSTNYYFQAFDPSVVFKLISDPNGQRYVYILQQIITNVIYERHLRYFYVEDNMGFVDPLNSSSLLENTFSNITTDQPIIAIFSYMIDDNQKESNLRNGLIIIIKNENHIKYCLSELTQLNQTCSLNQMKTLIDCSDYTPVPTHGRPTSYNKEPQITEGIPLKTILIVIIVIAVPVIVLLVAVLIYIFIRKKQSTTTTLSSSSSKGKSKDIKEGSDSNKSVVKTIFKREGWESEAHKQ